VGRWTVEGMRVGVLNGRKTGRKEQRFIVGCGCCNGFGDAGGVVLVDFEFLVGRSLSLLKGFSAMRRSDDI